MARIAPFGRYRALDANGDPLAGGKLFTYEAGTNTPKPTFTDKDGSTANTNPVILDSEGYADVWLDTGGYKFVLTDSADVEQWTADNIDGGIDGGFASSVISKSSSFALTTLEQGNVIVCTSSMTVSLLAAAIAGNGFSVILINTSTGNVTIDPDGSETINGESTIVFAPGNSISIHSDGSTWYAGEGSVPIGSVTPEKLAFGITGIVVPYAGSVAPTGWLICSGQAVSRTTFASLFAIIGTTYGVGDGSTTFNLPDLQGRVVAGLEESATRLTSGVSGINGSVLGAAGGNQNMHQHTHSVNDSGHYHVQGLVSPTTGTMRYGTTNTGLNASWFDGGSGTSGNLGVNTSTQTTGITLGNAGSGSSQNVQPTIVLNYIIKT